MDLKEFISDTITCICEGVKDAQERCAKINAAVHPFINEDRVASSNGAMYRKVTNISFKVALQTSDKENEKSGIGVLLANVTVGNAKETNQDFSSVTSVEFSVPVVLPLAESK